MIYDGERWLIDRRLWSCDKWTLFLLSYLAITVNSIIWKGPSFTEGSVPRWRESITLPEAVRLQRSVPEPSHKIPLSVIQLEGLEKAERESFLSHPLTPRALSLSRDSSQQPHISHLTPVQTQPRLPRIITWMCGKFRMFSEYDAANLQGDFSSFCGTSAALTRYTIALNYSSDDFREQSTLWIY